MSGNFKLVRHTTQVTNESEQILPHHAEERCKMLNDNKTSNESRKSIFLFLLFPVDIRKHFCCLAMKKNMKVLYNSDSKMLQRKWHETA